MIQNLKCLIIELSMNLIDVLIWVLGSIFMKQQIKLSKDRIESDVALHTLEGIIHLLRSVRIYNLSL